MPSGLNPGGVGYLHLSQVAPGELLMRGLGIKGDLPQLIDARLDPSVQVVDLTRPEYDWLARAHRYTQFLSIGAGGAGNFSQAALGIADSDQGRDTLAQVEQICIQNTSASNYAVQVGLSSSANVSVTATGVSMDDRNISPAGVLSNSRYQCGQTNIAVANPFGGGNFQAFIAAGQQLVLTGSLWTLTNKRGASGNVKCYVVCAAANLAMSVSYIWRERPVLPTELL